MNKRQKFLNGETSQLVGEFCGMGVYPERSSSVHPHNILDKKMAVSIMLTTDLKIFFT